MKKLTIILTLALLACFTSPSLQAQMSRKERKEWKKKAKEYKKNPEALQQLESDKQTLEKETSSLEATVSQLKSQISDRDAQIAELQADLTKARADLSAARKQVSEMRTAMASQPQSSGGEMIDGVVFKVQIGAFKNKDLSKYFENHENFGGETTEGGTQKITLGQFRDYWEADTFKKYLREMGVSDAWIVPYKDGQRVDIKEVLEGVVPAEDTGK